MEKFARRVRRLSQIGGEERTVFLVSLALLPLMAVGLHRFGMARLRAWLEGHSPQPAVSATLETVTRARRLGRMVNAAARLSPYKANCLKRSLTLWWLLLRRGIASDIRIGVRMGAGLEAHAWVEIAGSIVNDTPAFIGTFSPFAGDVMTAYRFMR